MFRKYQRSPLTIALFAALGAGSLALSMPAQAGHHAHGSGAAHSAHSSGNIVDAVVQSTQHSTLLAAVSAAGLADTLASPGPFTVFAPTNAAFGQLPAGTVNTLLQPANRNALVNVLTYHVVPGRVTSADLMSLISDGGGSAEVTTVSGGKLTARMQHGNLVLIDANGGVAKVTQANIQRSNGVIHVTDAVSLPR